MAQKLIDDGALIISNGKIAEVGRFRDLYSIYAGDRIDLGEVALLPGLINAHCHLDYTHMAGALPPPRSFPDWIKGILALKAQWSYSEFAASWIAGASQCLDHGITTVGDIEAVPELIEESWAATPLRLLTFVELTGVRSQREPSAVISEGLDVIKNTPKIPNKSAGLSPHAPYSTKGTLLSLVAKASEQENFRVSIHLAESQAEFDMFLKAGGPLYDWLKTQRDVRDCGHCSPVAHVDTYDGLTERTVAVHVNYLAPGDAFRLALRKTHVVHCPQSHEYFQHARFPYEELKSAGVNIALGTDSLASTRMRGKTKPELNLFDELAQFSSTHSGVRPNERLQLATLNAARALGMQGDVGQLSPAAHADVIALPFNARASEFEEWACHERPKVTGVMLAGNWVREPLAA